MTAPAVIAVGDVLPTLSMSLPAWRLVAYQGSTWDFHRGHHDWEFAQSVGEPAPYADGQLFGALMARLLSGWAGRDGFIRTLSFRLRDMVRPGELVNVSGVVIGVVEQRRIWRATVQLRVDAPAGTGEPNRSIAVGEAAVEVPRAGVDGLDGGRSAD